MTALAKPSHTNVAAVALADKTARMTSRRLHSIQRYVEMYLHSYGIGGECSIYSMSDPANFYTGLVADLYEPLAGGITDSSRFIKFVEKHGEPALEICCGTGLPLLDLIDAGLDVEGLDASNDMLEICKAKARKRGLRVTLHHAKMQSFKAVRGFRSAYIANGSITLLPSDADLRQTLRTIIGCLVPGGAVLIDLDMPDIDSLRKYIGTFRETRHEGCRIRVGMTHLEWCEEGRDLIIKLRYERISPQGEMESIDRLWSRKIWSPDQLCEQLVNSGFEIEEVEELDDGIIQVCASVVT